MAGVRSGVGVTGLPTGSSAILRAKMNGSYGSWGAWHRLTVRPRAVLVPAIVPVCPCTQR